MVRTPKIFFRVCLLKWWFWLNQILRNNFRFDEKIGSLNVRHPWKFYFLTVRGGKISVNFKWCHIHILRYKDRQINSSVYSVVPKLKITRFRSNVSAWVKILNKQGWKWATRDSGWAQGGRGWKLWGLINWSIKNLNTKLLPTSKPITLQKVCDRLFVSLVFTFGPKI